VETGAMTAALFEASSILDNLFLCVIFCFMISVVLNEVCRNFVPYTPGRVKLQNGSD